MCGRQREPGRAAVANVPPAQAVGVRGCGWCRGVSALRLVETSDTHLHLDQPQLKLLSVWTGRCSGHSCQALATAHDFVHMSCSPHRNRRSEYWCATQSNPIGKFFNFLDALLATGHSGTGKIVLRVQKQSRFPSSLRFQFSVPDCPLSPYRISTKSKHRDVSDPRF